MEPEVYKLILNVREVTERTKTLAFVNCRIKFNQMTQSSFVPFRQSLIFNFTPQDRQKTVEFRFEKEYREIARLLLRLDSHYLTNRFEMEKWFELENVDKGNKMLAKISLSTMKYTVETSRSRLSLKQNNFVETKPIEGSPRLSYLTNRLSYMKNPRTPGEDHYSQISPHQSIIDYNQDNYMSCPHPSLSSRHLDLRINLQSAVKNIRAEISPKDPVYTLKGRDVKGSYHPTKIAERQEPLTYRERETQEKRPISRKTKSLEKPINASGTERESKDSKYDESNYADSRFGSYRKSIDSSKDLQSSAKKYESRQESEKKVKEQTEKEFERVLRDRNTKMRKENKKFEQLIWDMERTRDKYEMEAKKNQEKLEFYVDKCSSLERELQFTQNQLALWKSKSEIIRLLENELEGLRRIIKEKDRNADMERTIQKKRIDFEKAMRELQEENTRHREKIESLENEIEDLTKKNHTLRQEKEKQVSENILLKVRVAALEVNEEQMKHLSVQKEEIVGEIDMLRTSNKQLRELIMDQKEILWQGDEQNNIKFNDSVNKLRRRIDNINNTTISHLHNVQNYLSSNFELKSTLDKLEEAYILDMDSQPSSPEKRYERERNIMSAGGELDRNLDMIKTFTDNNKRLEQYIYEAKTLKRDSSASTTKFKTSDFNPNSLGALKAIYSSLSTTRARPEKADEFTRKNLYVPSKDDPIDAKLAEFINSHAETKKLISLFKRKIPGVYIFGTIKLCPKLENGKLYVKEGKSYLNIDSFVGLNLDNEYEKLLSDGIIRPRKTREK